MLATPGPTLADAFVVPQLANAARHGVALPADGGPQGFARLRACASAAAAHPAFVAAHPLREPGFTEASYRAALAHYEYADYLTGDFNGADVQN